jgi:hypothetical protein
VSRKFILALATSLVVLANGTSVAYADSSSDETNTTQNTVVATHVERTSYFARREAIRATFQIAINSAREAFMTARQSATTDEARKSAEVAFQSAVRLAANIQSEALKVLGIESVKPSETDAQKAAFRVALTKFLEARKTILATFHASVANAQRVFKTARESASTDASRQAARQAFLAADRSARQTYQNALRALGDPPVKPFAPAASQ